MFTPFHLILLLVRVYPGHLISEYILTCVQNLQTDQFCFLLVTMVVCKFVHFGRCQGRKFDGREIPVHFPGQEASSVEGAVSSEEPIYLQKLEALPLRTGASMCFLFLLPSSLSCNWLGTLLAALNIQIAPVPVEDGGPRATRQPLGRTFWIQRLFRDSGNIEKSSLFASSEESGHRKLYRGEGKGRSWDQMIS